MSLRERTRPGLGIIEPYHARYSDFRRDPFTNHRGDVRLSFFRDGAPMTKPDRGELEVAAVVGAVLGGVTGYLLSNLVESGGWLKILIWAIIGAVVVTGMVFVFELFARERPTPLPAAVVCRGTKGLLRLRLHGQTR